MTNFRSSAAANGEEEIEMRTCLRSVAACSYSYTSRSCNSWHKGGYQFNCTQRLPFHTEQGDSRRRQHATRVNAIQRGQHRNARRNASSEQNQGCEPQRPGICQKIASPHEVIWEAEP